MAKKINIPLLYLDLSDMVSDKDRKKQECLNYLGEQLSASCCAVYLKEKSVFRLSYHYNPSAEINLAKEIMIDNTETLHAAACGEAAVPFTAIPYEEYLTLPLMKGQHSAGLLFIGWKSPCPLNQMSTDDHRFLKKIAKVCSALFSSDSPALKETEQLVPAQFYLQTEAQLNDLKYRLSVNLHDKIEPILLSMVMQLSMVQRADDMDYIKGRLEGMKYLMEQSLDEIRHFYEPYHSFYIERIGLKNALTVFCQDFVKDQFQLTFRFINFDVRLPVSMECLIFQAVFEILSHLTQLKSDSVTISLSIKNDKLLLQVLANDIKEIDGDPGLGELKKIEEQIKAVNGKSWIQHSNSLNWTLNILLPMQQAGGLSGATHQTVPDRRV